MISRINKDGARPFKMKPCTYCKGLGHLAFGCTKKPRKPMRASKPMKKVGRVGRATMQSNKEFLDSFSDDELYCFYCKHVGVHQLLERPRANAEHYYSRARHPELRLDNGKKVISCDYHNKDKGSLDGDEYLKKLDKERLDGTIPLVGNHDR